jgi:hypothetical protein
MNVDSLKPRFPRRVALLGVSALLGTAGVGTYLVVTAGPAAAHLTRATVNVDAAAPHVAAPPAAAAAAKAHVAAAPPVDGDNIQLQQGDQSGGQDGATGSTGEPTGSESDGIGGHADPAGSAGQQGDFNN